MNFPNIPLPVMPPDFALADLFRNTADVWRPADVEPVENGDIEAQDEPASYVKVASGVPCYYEATPDATTPQPPGRTPEKNQQVMSRWHFEAGVEVDDGYLIVMTGPTADQTGKANPYINAVWVVQANKTLNFSLAGRPADSQFVPALLNYDIKASDL